VYCNFKITRLITCAKGGTSGIGAMVARELASRGAQLVLLTQHELSDPFLVDFIMDLREDTNNELITAEHVNLSSLHSIRVFATKWVDNAPPRRLDMVILCANTMTPAGGKATTTLDGVESNWGINYMANFHLLSILSPALRAQPPDRDVRVIFGMCSSYMGGSLEHIPEPEEPLKGSKKPKATSVSKPSASKILFSPSVAYATSKYALLTFSKAFQKHLDAYQRPDKQPMNTRVICVDPGFTRTPGMRRYLSVGSLWGLFAYLLMWPLWWLVLKSPEQGAQSFLFAAMEAELGRGEGGRLIKECRVVKIMKNDVTDEKLQKALWEESEKTVEACERESAVRRALEKKEREEAEKAEKEAKEAAASGADTSKGNAEKQPGSRKSRKAA
jgi:NAD(P)-dependent dehydrogenase (short-subunit alcohol dehydrogenase family)